ncbi:MAG TPA: tipN [Brevundimonas sp.]|uniref:tipN n=1 Tax=Brevundimonas sp. TaxID=1871086 RepID=UPI002BC075FA|nr:tipN [Brevundimonas sp.]HRH20438.1 tipN [Brevundimonas sp.]
MKSRSKSSSTVAEMEPPVELVEPETASSKIAPPLVVEEPTAEVPAPTDTSRNVTAPSRPSPALIRNQDAPAAYPLAIIAALLWIGGVASYVAYQVGGGQLELDPTTAALIVLVALAPAGLALMVASLMRQSAALAAEVRRARGLADNLGLPTGVAVQESGLALIGLRSDIDQSTAAAETARTEIAALRAAMEEETRRLNDAADMAQRTARRITEQLSREREGLAELGERLESQTQGVIDTVERQARMVADASDLAQTQLREAEAALAARAADMASAAGEAQDAARAAADDLSRQTMRLETAGSGVADQIRSVEEGLSEQRAALVQAAFGLRRDQEDFSAQVESQRAQLTESLGQVRLTSSELNEHSTVSVTAIQDLLEAATDQVKALSDMSQNEARAFDARTREALDRFEDLAAQARENAVQESERTLADLQAALEVARTSTEEAVTSAQARLDSLGEMAFAAGKAADQAAESRLEATRRVVTETANLGEDAVARIASSLEESLLEVRAAIAHVEDSMRQMDERAARLPVDARTRVEEISAAVENGINALTEATRRAAAETEAVDTAFQERVKRNYEMLSEAVQLMGVVSGDTAASDRRTRPSLAAEPARNAPLGDRLRLTPTSKDEEVRKAFEPVSPPLAPQSEPMSWKELLASADEVPTQPEPQARPAPAPPVEVLFADLTAGIREMGIDPSALLPRTRVEEAARSLEAGDVSRSRDIVRRVAPAAVRRISRRVLTDRQMRADVEQFVHRYADVVEAAIHRPDGEAAGDLLGTEAGRTWLLLDAAVGDLS